MRPLERVVRTRRALAVTVALRAILGAVGAALGVAAVATVVAQRSAVEEPRWAWAIALAVAIVVLIALARPWSRLTVPRVALWIEEHVPRLQYALVTAVDPVTSREGSALLEHQIERVSWGGETHRAMARALAWPSGAAAIGLVLFLAASRLDQPVGITTDAVRTPRVTRDDRLAPAPFARQSCRRIMP